MSLDGERLNKSMRKLQQFLRKARRRPSPQEIHTFRTHTRRLEATLQALAMNLGRNERRLLRDMSRLRKRAGKIRDMDVYTGCASTLHANAEQDCKVQLLELLGAERYKHAIKLRALIGEYGPNLRRRLKHSSDRLEMLLVQADKNQTNGRSKPSVDAMATALQLSSELRTPTRLDKRNLHPYRLKVKRLRYILQMSDATDHQPFVDILGEVKDAIGEWHDSEELNTIANELLSHGKKCELLHELKTICGARYERALSLTNRMRETYLQSPDQRNAPSASKSKQARGLARSVLMATSAIAD